MFFIKVNSHRARNKLYAIVDEKTISYFHWDKEGEWHDVGNISDETKEEIKKIKGLTIPGFIPNGLMQHRSWN